VNCGVVGMCVEAVPVLGAESVDFLFSLCDLKILLEDHIQHIPWCIGYHTQDLAVMYLLVPQFLLSKECEYHNVYHFVSISSSIFL
jgi:hypothetical protein